MDISKFTIKELEQLFKPGQENQVTDELLAACRNDSRVAARKLVQKYERQQARLAEEKQRLLAMYQFEEEGRQIVPSPTATRSYSSPPANTVFGAVM